MLAHGPRVAVSQMIEEALIVRNPPLLHGIFYIPTSFGIVKFLPPDVVALDDSASAHRVLICPKLHERIDR